MMENLLGPLRQKGFECHVWERKNVVGPWGKSDLLVVGCHPPILSPINYVEFVFPTSSPDFVLLEIVPKKHVPTSLIEKVAKHRFKDPTILERQSISIEMTPVSSDVAFNVVMDILEKVKPKQTS